MAIVELSDDVQLDSPGVEWVPAGDKIQTPQGEQFAGPLSMEQVVSGAIKSTPQSGKQFIKDLITPFLSPKQTAIAIGGLAKGLTQKLIPGRQDNEQIVDDLAAAMKERYGGVENIKQTLATDPVGFVADISSILIPGGAAVKGLGVASKAKTVSKIGSGISKAGEILEPVKAVGKITKAVARKIIPESLPSEMFQSAAKFSTVIPEGDRIKLANTALENMIMPTVKGLDKIRVKINEFNDEITGLIDTATRQGKKIPVNALFSEFGELRKQLSGEPLTRRRQIGNIAKQISLEFKRRGKKSLTPEEAQQLKQAIYKETESYYGKIKNSPAKIEAKQAIARAAKDSLEVLFPEIKQLNTQEGALIALRKEIEKSASRISNRDLLGIGVPIKGGAGGAFGGVPGAVAGVAIGLFDTPQLKAKLAIVMDSLKKKGVVLSDDSILRKIVETTQGAEFEVPRQAGRLEQFEEERRQQ